MVLFHDEGANPDQSKKDALAAYRIETRAITRPKPRPEHDHRRLEAAKLERFDKVRVIVARGCPLSARWRDAIEHQLGGDHVSVARACEYGAHIPCGNRKLTRSAFQPPPSGPAARRARS